MKTRCIVCGVVQKNGQIVLGRKAQGRPPYPDLWHTPGGGVEDLKKAQDLISVEDYNNEYFLQELQRELKEELGVSVKNIKCIIPEFRKAPRIEETNNKHGEMTRYYFLEYLCQYESGNLKPADDLSVARWVDKKDLANFSLTPPSEEMYKELGWIK